jgi:hypothetical protein
VQLHVHVVVIQLLVATQEHPLLLVHSVLHSCIAAKPACPSLLYVVSIYSFCGNGQHQEHNIMLLTAYAHVYMYM